MLWNLNFDCTCWCQLATFTLVDVTGILYAVNEQSARVHNAFFQDIDLFQRDVTEYPLYNDVYATACILLHILHLNDQLQIHRFFGHHKI